MVQPAAANMANPRQPGDAAGEPGGVKTVAIEHEELNIDLRPLTEDAPSQISATYHVRNDGTAQDLDLLFVAVAHDGTPALVTLDDAPVPSTVTGLKNLPATWQPPKQTPALPGGEALSYAANSGSGVRFDLTLPPGRHTIQVHYSARAGAYADSAPARYWQLGYVLAPARDWASFGGLAVTVRLPHGWYAASTPALTRESDNLQGMFASIPADSLALTVQAPLAPAPNRAPLAWIGGGLLAFLAGGLLGLGLRRLGRPSWWGAPIALIAGAGLEAAVGASVVSPLDRVPEGQASWVYGYLHGPQSGGALLLAFLVGAALFQTAAIAFRRSSAVRRRAREAPGG